LIHASIHSNESSIATPAGTRFPRV
jgi:hypothetical protein